MNTRTRLAALAAVLAFVTLTLTLDAQVPQLINYQGRVAVGTVNFDGSGQFKFALVHGAGTATFWSNDDTSTAGHTAVWTGSEMIVWGGFNGTSYLNDTFSYTPGRVMVLYQRP